MPDRTELALTIALLALTACTTSDITDQPPASNPTAPPATDCSILPGYDPAPRPHICNPASANPWTMIAHQHTWQRGRPFLGHDACDRLDAECAGSIHPDAIQPGRPVDLLFQLDTGAYAIIANLQPVEHWAIASMVAMDRALVASPGYDAPNYAGPWRAIEPEARVVVNGWPIPTAELSLWLRGDGLWLGASGAGEPLVRFGLPSGASQSAAEIAGAHGAGQLFYRFSDAAVADAPGRWRWL